MVSFGQSSGAVPPLEIGKLSAKGSLFLTRPTLDQVRAYRAHVDRSMEGIFERGLHEDRKLGKIVEPGEFRVMVGPNSSDLRGAVLRVIE